MGFGVNLQLVHGLCTATPPRKPHEDSHRNKYTGLSAEDVTETRPNDYSTYEYIIISH